jgi:hypothetical protein
MNTVDLRRILDPQARAAAHAQWKREQAPLVRATEALARAGVESADQKMDEALSGQKESLDELLFDARPVVDGPDPSAILGLDRWIRGEETRAILAQMCGSDIVIATRRVIRRAKEEARTTTKTLGECLLEEKTWLDELLPWRSMPAKSSVHIPGVEAIGEQRPPCPDCKGTGLYQGLFIAEPCRTCGGGGRCG